MASNTTVERTMNKRRMEFLARATKPAELKFGNDLDVLNFIINDYHYCQWNNHGNAPSLQEWPAYRDYYYIFTHKNTFEDMLNGFKEDYKADDRKDKVLRYLIDTARKIRRRYGRT